MKYTKIMYTLLALILLIMKFSIVQLENSCNFDKVHSKAIEKLANLTDDNMFLRIIVYKYEITPFQKWPEKQNHLKPNQLKEKSVSRRSASRKVQKTKIIEFFKIDFRVEHDKGMFNNKDTTYVFKDKHQNKQIKELAHVQSQEEKASLNITSKEINLNLEFHIGPKRKKIQKVNDIYYGNQYRGKKKDAFLIEPNLELGYGEPLSYHVFMCFQNKSQGEEKPNIKALNAVDKAIKEIIQSSDPKPANGSFRWERKEKVISNIGNSLCDFLKPWIKPSDSGTINIDLYSAVEHVMTNPDAIFKQEPHKGDIFGFGLNNFDFPSDKFKPNTKSTSSAATRKLFNQYFTDFQRIAKPHVSNDGETNDTEYLKNFSQSFKRIMNQNFKKYREQNNIPGEFKAKEFHLDTIIHQAIRTANETDANSAVFKTFHIDSDGKSSNENECKKRSATQK